MNARRLFFLIALFLAVVLPTFSQAQAQSDDATLRPLIDALAPGNFRDREAAAAALAATEDPRAVPVLQTLLAGDLYVVEATRQVVFLDGKELSDPVTGETVAGTKADTDKVKVNNGLRRALRTLIGQLTLMSDDRAS
jgi:urea transport system permease protein